MNSFERKIAKNMEDHGWFTEIHEEKKSSQRIVDIFAYKPKTGKMFWKPLSARPGGKQQRIVALDIQSRE